MKTWPLHQSHNKPWKNPQWFTQGTTYLLPKPSKTNIPKNYRPIIYLSALYKILTSIVTERTYIFLDANNILPSEQKGCKKRSCDCKDQLLINKMLLENSGSCHRNWLKKRLRQCPTHMDIKSASNV